ncbi:MAG: hypothetical protein SGILL_002446 [Bacillariaceae sp.]
MASSYPTTPAKNKHDLLCIDAAPGTSKPPSLEDFQTLVSSTMTTFTTSEDLFASASPDPSQIRPHQVASLYSYEDGPDLPGPLSRTLLIFGVADRSQSLVKNILESTTDSIHCCTVAVQLGDAKHFSRLDKKHQHNSTQFARFMVALRVASKVAVVAKDKYGRFALLVPLDSDSTGDADFTANDFVAQCYIGNVDEVKEFLSKIDDDQPEEQSSRNAWGGGNDSPTYQPEEEDGDNVNGSEGGWKPTTPPWKPTTPPLPPSDGDDGPTYQADDDDDDDDDANNNGGWKPSTPPIPPGDGGGDDTNGFSAPWDTSGGDDDNDNTGTGESSMPWETTEDSQDNGDTAAAMPWETQGDDGDNGDSSGALPWETNDTSNDNSGNKRSFDEMNVGAADDSDQENDNGDQFHKNKGAAEADAFYSGLTRSLDTRADSYLYHMRSFNGWVKATQIAELDPVITVDGKIQPKQKLRVLDLACGKGGDLTKWTLHKRGMRHYVGIDVARGSLKDAAERARGMRQKKRLEQAVFSCADLGEDVPGRKKTPNSKRLQKLLTWKLEDEGLFESGEPEFKNERGGGIAETDKFDVVSIQFAIHYMMQTRQRARRFFHTVSQLLEVGGLLAFTTIDARVIIDHMMNLGLDFHFEDGEEPEFSEVVVKAGSGACKLKFEPKTVRKLMTAVADGSKAEEDLFGLEYTFTLVEGSDHAAGVGDAVNLPEWLIPIPVLVALGKEAGLELDYAQNFHEFYHARKDPSKHPAAHQALQNMKVLNRNGTMSKDEWSVSRLYAAMTFRKVRESSVVFGAEGEMEEDDDDDDDEEEVETIEEKLPPVDPVKAAKLMPMALLRAKKAAGDDWSSFTPEQKQEAIDNAVRTMM